MKSENKPSRPKKVLIAGASGMVGSLLLQHCIEDASIGTIISLVRKSSSAIHPKVKEILINDFSDYSNCENDFKGVDFLFFCIGVYTGAVGRPQFRKITVDYPVTLGKAVLSQSPQAHFCLLSGSGADRTEKSKMMFAKDKGAAENQLNALGFAQFYTFRPGYIYPVTPREEPNFTYRLARWLYPIMKAMGPSASITSEELAKAIFFIGQSKQDQEIFENKDMIEWLQQPHT